MRYYNYEQSNKMKAKAYNWKIDGILQKTFPDNDKWGATVLFNENGNVDLIEIFTLHVDCGTKMVWEHNAVVSWTSEKQSWELSSLFNGEHENELWVYAYYKRFGDAVRNVANGINRLKPIKKYK